MPLSQWRAEVHAVPKSLRGSKMCCTNSPDQSRIPYDPIILHSGPCPALTTFSNTHTPPHPPLTFFLRGLFVTATCHTPLSISMVSAISMARPKWYYRWESHRPPQYAPPKPAPIRASWMIGIDVHGCIENNACIELRWSYPHFLCTSSKWCFSIQSQYAGALEGTCFSWPL